jgi:alanine transaminase
MVPIPQYPLYSAQLTLEGGTMVKYYLDEEKNWGVDSNEIVQRIKNAKDLGINLRAIVVINPGNPTGNVLDRENIRDIINICYENNLVIIADEVYQANIYNPERPFISFREVLHEMGEPFRDNVELISLHSVSKGLSGECGLRGGYMEAHNFDLFAQDMLFKLKSIDLCANTIGQCALYQMVKPPTLGE